MEISHPSWGCPQGGRDAARSGAVRTHSLKPPRASTNSLEVAASVIALDGLEKSAS